MGVPNPFAEPYRRHLLNLEVILNLKSSHGSFLEDS